MNSLYFRMLLPLSRALWLVTIMLLLASCTVFEPGVPIAAITVKARSSFEVQAALENVFREEGYRVSGRDPTTLTFERDGTKTDAVFHGNWQGGEVAHRVRVSVTDQGDGRYRMRCLPSIVRDPSDVAFEDEHRRMALFSPHYSHMLREARRKLR